MASPSMLMTLLAETSLHPGTGQSVGAIDLPIQRERHTGFPVIQASSLKGSLRHAAEECYGNPSDIVTAIFGPPEKPEHAGALQVFDAHLLALPVRAFQQVFVWVTCPLVLARLKRNIAVAGFSAHLVVPDVMVRDGCAQVMVDSDLAGGLVLEDLVFTLDRTRIPADVVRTLSKLAPAEIGADWTKRLAIISDEDFRYLATLTTPVSARVQLTPGKTTDSWMNPYTGTRDIKGNFWYEETLPPDTLLYAVLAAAKPKDGKGVVVAGPNDVIKKMQEVFSLDSQGRAPYLQVGGDETVGQGWCRVAFFLIGGPS